MKMKMFTNREFLAKFAVVRYWKVGHCKNPTVRTGYHRAGIVPSLDIVSPPGRDQRFLEMCIDCGEVFAENIWLDGENPKRSLINGRE